MPKKYPISELLKNNFYHRSRPSENLYERVDSDFRVIEGELVNSKRKKRLLAVIIGVIIFAGLGYLLTLIDINPGFKDIPGYENWSRYVNDEQGYSINYPPEFKYVDERDAKQVSIGDGMVPKISIFSFYDEDADSLQLRAKDHLEKMYSNVVDVKNDVIRTEKTIGQLLLVTATYGANLDGYDGQRTLNYIQNGNQIILIQTLSNYRELTQTEFQEKVLGSFQILVTGKSKYRLLSAEELLEKYFIALRNFDYHTQYELQELDNTEEEYRVIADKRYTGVLEFSFSKAKSLGNDEYEYFVILSNPDGNQNLRVKKSIKDGKIKHLENKYFDKRDFVNQIRDDDFYNKIENRDGQFPLDIYKEQIGDLEITDVYINTVSLDGNSYKLRFNVDIQNNGPDNIDLEKEFYVRCVIDEEIKHFKSSSQACSSWFQRGKNNNVAPCFGGGTKSTTKKISVGENLTMQIYSNIDELSDNISIGCLLNYPDNIDPENNYSNNYVEKFIPLKARIDRWGYGYTE